jgi:hypothetical protein
MGWLISFEWGDALGLYFAQVRVGGQAILSEHRGGPKDVKMEPWL